MEPVTTSYAGQLITAAITANAIKLNGAGGTPETAAKNAQADAAYLLNLFKALTTKPGS